MDVVVFPRTYAETGPVWRDDAVLLVAGRVDHKGDETVVLADSVWPWEDAAAMDPEAFARQVAAGDRGRRGPRRENGRPGGPPVVAVPMGPPSDPPAATDERVTIPRISPLRGSQPQGTLTITIGAPMGRRAAGAAVTARGVSTDAPMVAAVGASLVRAHEALGEAGPLLIAAPEPGSLGSLAAEGSEEPPLPEEAGVEMAQAAGRATTPHEAGSGQSLHVHFGIAPDERIVAAFTELRALIRERPGVTPVGLHIPAGTGRTREMRLGSRYRLRRGAARRGGATLRRAPPPRGRLSGERTSARAAGLVSPGRSSRPSRAPGRPD